MNKTEQMGTKRYLLVQSCHLPHFFFVAGKLRERYPDIRFDALMTSHPQARFYADFFPVFEDVFYSNESGRLGEYDGVIFPLLGRGYRQIKKLALGKGPLLRADFAGNLAPVGRLRLLSSAVYVSDRPTSEFAAYLGRFPHRLGPERVLLIESCHGSLVAKSKTVISQVLREGAELTTIRKAPLRNLLRRLRDQEFDTACVFFSGETGFLGLKLLPFLLRIRRIVIINENRDFFEASGMSLARFLYRRIIYGAKSPSPLAPRIVLFQTESTSYLRHAAARLKQRRLFPHSELIVVCRPEDRAEAEAIPEINQVFCYPKRTLRQYYRVWRKLDRLQPDLAFGIFSGRPVHRWEKVLFLCLPVPQHLAFNARLDCYQVSLLRFLWMFRSEPLVFDEQLMALARMKNHTLLLHTADDRRMLKAIGALRHSRITRLTSIAILCREEKRAVFERVPGVAAVYTYRPGRRWENLRTFFRLRKLRVDTLAAVPSGEPSTRLHKLLFLFLPARRRVVLDSDYNCCYLSRLNPLSLALFFHAHKRRRCILLIQTADDSLTLRALDKARDPKVTKPLPFVVFCREDKKDLFAVQPDVASVVTYKPDRRFKSPWSVLQLFILDIEVVAGLFTGEPIFHLQKLLFFLVSARNRLVFNHNLDCYYLNRSTFWSLFRSEEKLGQLSSSLLAARLFAKVLLFLPRFFFLVIWVTGQKLKRAYILASEVR